MINRLKNILSARGVDLAAIDFTGGDVLLRDDGKGPVLAEWNAATLGPRPSEAEIAAASANLAAPRIITPRAFRERLTLAEQAAIMQAAMADVDVLDWRLRAAEAQEIDLDHPETVAGLDFLISKGLLTAERRAAILA